MQIGAYRKFAHSCVIFSRTTAAAVFLAAIPRDFFLDEFLRMVST